jgi:hypothetical protein
LCQNNEVTIPSSTTQRVFAALGVLGVAGGAFVVGYFNPVTAGFFPQCPFHAMTGLNCPGCGITRGFNALFKGNILEALHFNALIPFYLIIFGYFVVSLLLVAGRGYGLSWNFFTPKLMYGFLIFALIYAVLRNLPFYPFDLLWI